MNEYNFRIGTDPYTFNYQRLLPQIGFKDFQIRTPNGNDLSHELSEKLAHCFSCWKFSMVTRVPDRTCGDCSNYLTKDEFAIFEKL